MVSGVLVTSLLQGQAGGSPGFPGHLATESVKTLTLRERVQSDRAGHLDPLCALKGECNPPHMCTSTT